MSAQSSLLRAAIIDSVPKVPAQFDAVAQQFIYIPGTHRRALEADAMLVEGARGAGKSFWWFVLQDEALRNLVLGKPSTASVGFGEKVSDQTPTRDELIQLVELGHKPRLIWKAVVLAQFGREEAAQTWKQRVKWVVDHPSEVAQAFRTFDSNLTASGKIHLVLFDALDKTADSIVHRTDLLKGLLELVLELRPYAALRAKVFARPDMLANPLVRTFSDASKVLASAVRLDWRTVDLYALLYQYLGNGSNREAADAFRAIAGSSQFGDGQWDVPSALKDDEEHQQAVFKQIAGPWMGTNRRRGKTYTWVPNHLADALDVVSPRSFLAAIREAAEMAPAQGYEYPLHWSGLQQGVRHASDIRVAEIQEDLPWVHTAMDMLGNMVVPCPRSTVINTWKSGNLLKAPLVQETSLELDGVLEELGKMGILKVLPNGRINIPDVYRVGFGLRRRGGLRPKA